MLASLMLHLFSLLLSPLSLSPTVIRFMISWRNEWKVLATTKQNSNRNNIFFHQIFIFFFSVFLSIYVSSLDAMLLHRKSKSFTSIVWKAYLQQIFTPSILLLNLKMCQRSDKKFWDILYRISIYSPFLSVSFPSVLYW